MLLLQYISMLNDYEDTAKRQPITRAHQPKSLLAHTRKSSSTCSVKIKLGLCSSIELPIATKKFTNDLMTPLVVVPRMIVPRMICTLQELNQVSFQHNRKMDM